MRTKALQAESKEAMERAQALQRPAVSMPQPIGVAATLLSLQRSHGNRYVQRLLRSRRMQAKLTISEPGDQYEQEADRVAETVMRMPDPIVSEGVAVSGQVKDGHTQPVSSADAEHLHRQTMDEEMPEEEEETLQAKEVSGETPEVTPELEARLTSARGSGQPLPEPVRAFFEPRFGYDFSGVRVHTDGQAVDSARSVKAHAYTLGQDIVFGSGQYAPETPAGKQLLAHELTHVVQQTGAMASTAGPRSAGPLAPSAPLHPSQSGILERKCACGGAAGLSGECEACGKRLDLQTKLTVSEPGDVFEQEADRVAEQVLATPARHAVSGAPPRIQRFSGQSNGQMDAAPASVDQALASPGRPLEPVPRQDMEQRFAHDSSSVRIHSGAAAESSARGVNAQAYTVGHDVVLGAGRLALGTNEGRRLIARELTHVVQQSGADGMRLAQSREQRGLSPISVIQQLHHSIEQCGGSDGVVRRKGADVLSSDAAPGIVREVLGNSGRSLEPEIRTFMETDFGHDFGNVRVHDDRRVAESAAAVNALAYTVGDEIVFASGRHTPGSSSGKWLVTHELTHVVQQHAGRAPVGTLFRKATADDEKGKVEAVNRHKEHQKQVIQFVDNARKVKADPSNLIGADTLLHNTVELLDGGKLSLSVLSPIHDWDTRNAPELTYFDPTVRHPEIKGDYPADPDVKKDKGLVAVASTTAGSAKGAPCIAPYQPMSATYKKIEITDPDRAKPQPPLPPTYSWCWSPAEVKIFAGKGDISEEEFKNTLVHEGQHAADLSDVMMKDTTLQPWQQVFEHYKSEFRAFWIEPPRPWACPPGRKDLCIATGVSFPAPDPIKRSEKQDPVTVAAGKDCFLCPGPAAKPAKDVTVAAGMKNKRQEKIFRYLLSLYSNDQFECLYVCNKDFRDAVNNFDFPQGLNVVNSARLLDLNLGLRNLKRTMTTDELGKTALYFKIERLDDVDWAFLQDRKYSAPFWAVLNANAPAAVYKAVESSVNLGRPDKPALQKAFGLALIDL